MDKYRAIQCEASKAAYSIKYDSMFSLWYLGLIVTKYMYNTAAQGESECYLPSYQYYEFYRIELYF